ncbi:2Fe-2S ferredoxin-type domain-containing protein [Lipomyces doorenjongii]
MVIFTTRNLAKSMSSHTVVSTVCRREGLLTCDQRIHVTFITREGDQVHIDAAEGDNLLDIAQAHDLDMEGACGGSCACSTCHVIVDPEFYDLIPEPDDDENDMLDLAFGLTETSRLGCQVKLTKELDGLRVALPQMTRNLQAKDFEKR